MKGMDSIFNLFLDRIYMINWIFLVPHFPEKNAETQSDYVGNKYRIHSSLSMISQVKFGHRFPQIFGFCSFQYPNNPCSSVKLWLNS